MKSTLILCLSSLLSAVSTIAIAGGPHGSPEEQRLPRPITGAKEAFNEAAQRIHEDYVDAGLSEDELWTGAITGMLDRLIQTKGKKVNALLDPEQLRAMHEGLKGSVSGVGVGVKLFENVVWVQKTIPGSPAEAAGLKPGDRILAVNGKTLRGLEMIQIVELIRGPDGTTVDLLMQRDQNEWTVPLTRTSIPVPAVTTRMLDNGTGYLQIFNFNENTAKEIDRAFESSLKNASSLVIDVRGCPGGLLDSALSVADRFLAPGKKIVTLRGRDGKDDTKMTKTKDRADAMPLVVLIDKHTASSSEIVAAALADHGRARLVGEATLGKSTVERIVGLKSGWALKLSVARFYSPKGKTWQDTGITPDFAISMPELSEEDGLGTVEKDAALRSALKVLEMEIKK